MNTISSPLHVNDLILMKNIIDVALSRGTFRGEEIGAVAEVYTKLTGFLDVVATPADTAEGSDQDVDNSADESDEEELNSDGE